MRSRNYEDPFKDIRYSQIEHLYLTFGLSNDMLDMFEEVKALLELLRSNDVLASSSRLRPICTCPISLIAAIGLLSALACPRTSGWLSIQVVSIPGKARDNSSANAFCELPFANMFMS